jgi:hypothetical protein
MPSGNLNPGQWKTVMTGWGRYTVRYRAWGLALPVRATFTFGGDQTLQNGQEFEFAVWGYSRVRFRSDSGGPYTIDPA